MTSVPATAASQLLKALHPNQLVKALSGAAVVWRWLPDDQTSTSRIHHVFRREVWRTADLSERILLATGFLLWLPVTTVLALVCCARMGSRVHEETRKSHARQLYEQMALACHTAVPPPWYYMFEFYRAERSRDARAYLYRFETKTGIYEFLRAWLSSTETTEALRDKARFAARCDAFGLSTIRVLATARDGRVFLRGGGSSLPPTGLFVKPIRGAGGRGAERWLWNPHTCRFQSNDDRALDGQALLRHLERRSRIEPLVVREYVRNHREVRDLSPGVLSTVRVLTCMNERGEPEVTHAVLRMARSAKVVVDNFHAGGIAAKVEIASGRLGSATDMGLTAESRWWDHHPVTNARIRGRTLPYWPQVLALATRAHDAFADQVAIGWDIAILDNGPCLVEGNKSPDLDIIQRTHQTGIGGSRLADLLAYHLERALERKYGVRESGFGHADETSARDNP